jgi:glycosyltransferase involved in cell wall biosynthesis
MGIVALEGMAAGKPLVVSRVDGLCEVALEGIGCRQVGVGDVAELAGALEWLGASAGRTVPENQQRALKFQWRKIGHQYLAAYEEAQRMMGDDAKVALSGLRLAS